MKKIITFSFIGLLMIIIIIIVIGRIKPNSSTTINDSQPSPFPTIWAVAKTSTTPKNNSQIGSYQRLPIITPIMTENFDYQQSTTPKTIPLSPADLKNGAVYETDNLKISYSSALNKYVFNKKTYLAQKEIDEWARANEIIDQIDDDTIFVDQTTITPTTTNTPSLTSPPISPSSSTSSQTTIRDENAQLLADLFQQLFSIPIGGNPTDIDSSINPAPTLISATSSATNKAINLTYFAQCNGQYDSYPLPRGCTLCKAGCGPTTATMVIASYANSGFIPPTTVNYYQKQQFPLGCDGSMMNDLKQALANNGIKTTPYLVFNGAVSNQIVPTLKQYLSDGWTLVTLGEYADGSPSCGKCGHFFWIVDVDANDNIWAYDPFYGRRQNPQPFNENSLYPYPKYIAAFGVKPNR